MLSIPAISIRKLIRLYKYHAFKIEAKAYCAILSEAKLKGISVNTNSKGPPKGIRGGVLRVPKETKAISQSFLSFTSRRTGYSPVRGQSVDFAKEDADQNEKQQQCTGTDPARYSEIQQ